MWVSIPPRKSDSSVTSTYLCDDFISAMQEVWLRCSLWLHGGYRHIHRRRHIEISICVSFDYLLLQAYWGFFVLETEVIDMDRKKNEAPLSQQHWCFCTSLKSPVPGFTDLGGQGMNQCSLLLLGVRRGLPLRGKSWSLLVVVMVDCSLRPHCPARHHLPAVRK